MLRSGSHFLFQPRTLISLLLLVFFLKGVFLAALFPMFTGQDEARHYNTVQYLNEPAEKSWPRERRLALVNRETFAEYNFSDEILRTGTAAGLDRIRQGLYETADFADSSAGSNESQITAHTWPSRTLYYPPDTAGTSSLYHQLAALIEDQFKNSDILVRFYLIRIFSVLLGTFAVWLAYRIALTIGLSPKASLILAALVAFQPKFAMYFTNINYDVLLIPAFFLFTLGGVLSLRDGLRWSNGIIMVGAFAIGFLTKATIIILTPVLLGLLGYHALQRVTNRKTALIAGALFILFVLLALIPLQQQYQIGQRLSVQNSPSATLASIESYLSKSLTLGRFGLTSRTYWGSLDWDNSPIAGNITNFMMLVNGLAIIGLIRFFRAAETPTWLPQKKFLVLLLLMLLMLQLGIRAADWSVFKSSGKLDLGTPGRYFLPNLAAHLIVVFVGLGMLLRKKEYFERALAFGFILMFFFSLSLTYDIILPRFYL